MQFLGSTWRSSAGRYELDVAGPQPPTGRAMAPPGTATASPTRGTPSTPSTPPPANSSRSVAEETRGWPPRATTPARPTATQPPARATPPVPSSWSPTTTRSPAPGGREHRRSRSSRTATDCRSTRPDCTPSPPTRPPRDPEWQLVKLHHSGRVGIDISLRVGTPLYALLGGHVVWAGESGNFGYGLAIRNPDQHASVTYCHLSAIDVTAGQQVVAGQPVGRSGGQPGTPGAGNSTGPHLHPHIDTPQAAAAPRRSHGAMRPPLRAGAAREPVSGPRGCCRGRVDR